jgi:glycolate oxidase iron-sulfur subunit
MRTRFSAAQLANPALSEANAILRACVHCGYCLATCPTYLLTGDELDSPRGRIYLAKEMLESGAPPGTKVVRHLDRCLSCLSCMTTCPSGVDYAHLIDHARGHIEKTHRRPLPERLLRRLLATVVPDPRLFRLSARAGRLARPLQTLLPGRLKGMLAMAPERVAPASACDRPQVFAPEGARRLRVALFTGCAQQVLSPPINEATVRLLRRHGCEVVVAQGAGCCGAIDHHMGREQATRRAARANIAAWRREIEGAGLDAIVFNASGCGVLLKDYGHLLRDEPAWAAPAATVATLARDVSEILVELGLRPAVIPAGRRVAYHMACSMQHGLRLRTQAKALLTAAGFAVVEPAEAHICCGSAGTYSILEPGLADGLRRRKVDHLEATGAAVIAAGNIGCITHIAAATGRPVLHTVELLDWATGGPKPAGVA